MTSSSTALNFATAKHPVPSFTVEDLRGYGPDVIGRLKQAIEENRPARPDHRHPQLFVIDAPGESFYIAPLPSGKIVLLARWPRT